MAVRQHALLVPFQLDPGRIPDNQVEAAALGEQVGKFQLPVHKAVLLRDAPHQGQAGEYRAQFVYIHPAFVGVKFFEAGHDVFPALFLLGGQQAQLLGVKGVGLSRGGEGALQNQAQIVEILLPAGQQLRLCDGPEPQGAPVVHGELQAGVGAGVLHVLGFIEFAENGVLLADGGARGFLGILAAVNAEAVLGLPSDLPAQFDLLAPQIVDDCGQP